MNDELKNLAIKNTPLSKGWFFHILPFETPAGAFDNFAPIVELWRSKMKPLSEKSSTIPPWRSFTFPEFKGWHHHICLSEVSKENSLPKFRIMPTGLVTVLNHDFTGETMDKALPTASKEQIAAQYEILINGPHLGMTTGILPIEENNKTAHFTGLELPLSTDGKNVDQFLHALNIVEIP